MVVLRAVNCCTYMFVMNGTFLWTTFCALLPLLAVLTSRLRRLRTGFDLPRFRGRRGGRRKHKKIAVINRTSDRTSMTKASGVDFTNLVSVPLSSDRPSTKKTRKVKVAVFNAWSVGEKS